jgi:serine/threonine protein kinase
VYQAKHKIDNQVYAIKKIVLKIKNKNIQQAKEELERTIKEARLIAEIKDTNIIRYNDSWLEVTTKDSDYEDMETVNEGEEVAECPEIDFDSPYVSFCKLEPTQSESVSKPGYNDLSSECKKLKNNNEDLKGNYTKIALYIQMELCKKTLDEHLQALNSKYPLLLDEKSFIKRLGIARQIVQALYTIHIKHNLIHRDLSLKNIFIGMDRLVKIGDFGLATKCQVIEFQKPSPTSLKPKQLPTDSLNDPPDFLLDESLGSLCTINNCELSHGLGTKTFASPEQMSDRPYDRKVCMILRL